MIEAALLKRGAHGVPPLRLSDAELRADSPHDVELYQLLLRTLRQRVRAVEATVNASIWDCAGGARATTAARRADIRSTARRHRAR